MVANVDDAIGDAGDQTVFVASFQNGMAPTLPAVRFVSSIEVGVSLMTGEWKLSPINATSTLSLILTFGLAGTDV